MSDLTLGGPDIPWSHPSPVYNPVTKTYEHEGYVFMGLEPVTQEDYDKLSAYTGKPVTEADCDAPSLVGRHHPDWNSHFYESVEPHQRPGGLGSDTYREQKVGDGVKFATKAIWHTNAEGNMVKEIPGDCGEYHTVMYPGGYADNFVGPAPESQAEERLGDGSYYFDDNHEWYAITR